MGWLLNDRKLKAAATSMHQFCQPVREIFPGDVDDRIVEASTLYLYMSLTRDLFGPRFATKLLKKVRPHLKYCTPAEVEGHVARIMVHAEALERATASMSKQRTPEEICRAHTSCVIEAMLDDAGFNARDPESQRQAYIKFEEAILGIRRHLKGIREQNYFVMKSRSAA